jgi:hypothetical protein
MSFTKSSIALILILLLLLAITRLLDARRCHNSIHEEEIAQAMAIPFTVADMRLLIRKKSNTAPGLTGLTYQMLSLLPDEATLDLFKLMDRMWGAKHVPEFWKLKGLIGIPKTEVVTGVNDLRPIGLIETTRKLWTTMPPG